MENVTVRSVPNNPDTISLTQNQVFASTEQVLISDVTDVAADRQGRVYISDNDQHMVHVFNPDGSYRRQLGREGKGPGEFQWLWNTKTHGNTLFAFDRTLRRINTYSLDTFQPTRPIPLNPSNWNSMEGMAQANASWDFYPQTDSTILIALDVMHANDNRVKKYFTMDMEGTIVSDQILKQKDVNAFAGTAGEMRFSMFLPFSRKPLLDVIGDNRIFSAWSEEMLVKVYDNSGNYLRAFYYPFQNSRFYRDQFLSQYSNQSFRDGISKADFPATWPALEAMLIDDQNRLWIATIVDNQQIHEWWVLDEEGQLLALFAWPRDKPMYEVQNGYFYTKETAPDSGEERVVRYRIAME